MSAPSREWLDDWHVNPSVNRDYDFIDGLRGIAIVLVVGCHLIYINPLAGKLTHFLGGIFAAGSCGVTVFFALSGFLISWPFWKRKVNAQPNVVPSGYGWRRFWKIYPPLALSLLVLTPIYALRTRDSTFFPLAAQWLCGLPLVRPVSGGLNPVMWSLVVEVHFYILLPLLFLSLKKVSDRAALWTLFVLSLLLPTAWRWWNAAHGIYFSLHPQMNVHFPSMLDAFAFGILIAGLDNLGLLRKSWARFGDVGILLLAVALLTSSWLSLDSGLSPFVRSEVVGWIVKIASGCLLCYAADPGHPRAVLLSNPWLRWCGLISYEWYLFHQPIIIWGRALLGTTEGNFLKYVGVLGGVFLAGLLLAAMAYKYFSLPILKHGRAKHAVTTVLPEVQVVRELEKV